MRNQPVYLGLCVAFIALVGGVLWQQSSGTSGSTRSVSLQPGDVAVGEALYTQNCAACHGVNLEGEENWQTPREDGSLPAPPHDASGHTWHHPDSMLFTYTKMGGEQTLAAQGIDFVSGMPGFGGQLSDEEIWNILAYIKSKWPERERAAQANRTAQEMASKGDGQ